MSSSGDRSTSEAINALAHSAALNYSFLVVAGAIMALAILSGCASPPMGGSSDPYQYNTATGYPAVGSELWH